MATVTVVCDDGEEVDVPKELVKDSKLFENVMADDDDGEKVPLPLVSKRCLLEAMEYLRHHVNNPMAEIKAPLENTDLAKVLKDPWDVEWTRKLGNDRLLLVEMVKLANYLGHYPLLDIICATIASKINGKSPADIRREYGMPPLSEEEQRKEDSAWCR